MDNENKNYNQVEQAKKDAAINSFPLYIGSQPTEPVFQSTNYQPEISYQANNSDKKLIIRNAALGSLILIVIVAGIIFAFSFHHKSTINLESKTVHQSQQASLNKSAPVTSSGNSSQTAASATPAPQTNPSTSQSSTTTNNPQPQAYSLNNSNNGQTLTIPMGSIVNLSLAAQPGYQSTYHWDQLASTETSTDCSNPINSICYGLYNQDNINLGSDGSFSDTHMVFGQTGNDILSYAYRPNCDASCAPGQGNPIATWQVTIHVQ